MLATCVNDTGTTGIVKGETYEVFAFIHRLDGACGFGIKHKGWPKPVFYDSKRFISPNDTGLGHEVPFGLKMGEK